MPTPFEEIHNLNVAAWKAYRAWEQEVVTFSNQLSEELRLQLDWDSSTMRRVEYDSKRLDPDAKINPGGFSDPNGYHFALRFEVGTYWTQRPFTVRRGAEKGSFVVKSGDVETVVTLAERTTVEPLVRLVVEQLRELVFASSLASVTGFTG